ncbi:hypothetical protein JCM8202v2_002498 [Rhodotorula sphaerocarpa]
MRPKKRGLTRPSRSDTSAGTLSTASTPSDWSPRITEQSVNVRLGNIELRETVMSNLLESFFTFRTIATFSHEVDFHMSFNRAGRRLDQLSDTNQVLCATLLAIGARCSDHPALIGPGALRITDLAEATRNDLDLRSYGQAREAAYRNLAEQALKFADEKALFRQQSPESVAALMFLEGLSTGKVPVDPIFAKTCAMQVREMLVAGQEDPEVRGSVQNTTLAWTAVLRDALACAYNGSTFSFSDDDLWLLRGEQDPPPPLLDQLAEPLLPQSELNYWTLLSSILQHTIELCRETPAGLTGVRALRKDRIDEEFARGYVERCRLALSACRELRKRAKLLHGPSRVVRDAETLARTISLSAINLQFILHRIVHERLERRPAGVLCELDSSAGAEELDDYWTRLAQLAEEVDFAVFECSREIVVLLKDVLQAEVPLGTHEWLDPRSVQVLFSRTSLWAGAIVHARTREEGGMLDYSIEDKLTDLRWTARALRSIGWSSAIHAEPLPWIEREIAVLEARRGEYCPSFAEASAGVELALSTLTGLPVTSEPFDPTWATTSLSGAPGLDPPMDANALLASLGVAFPANASLAEMPPPTLSAPDEETPDLSRFSTFHSQFFSTH